jgi:hypothetical protein
VNPQSVFRATKECGQIGIRACHQPTHHLPHYRAQLIDVDLSLWPGSAVSGAGSGQIFDEKLLFTFESPTQAAQL